MTMIEYSNALFHSKKLNFECEINVEKDIKERYENIVSSVFSNHGHFIKVIKDNEDYYVFRDKDALLKFLNKNSFMLDKDIELFKNDFFLYNDMFFLDVLVSNLAKHMYLGSYHVAKIIEN